MMTDSHFAKDYYKEFVERRKTKDYRKEMDDGTGKNLVTPRSKQQDAASKMLTRAPSIL